LLAVFAGVIQGERTGFKPPVKETSVYIGLGTLILIIILVLLLT
jgi:hypothetical protein